MKTHLIAAAVAATLAAPVHADQQANGAGIGGLVGAIAGGPLGLVVGGALGAHLGWGMDKEEAAAEAESRMAAMQREAARLRAELARSRDELRTASTRATSLERPVMRALTAVEPRLHFRHGSDQLEAHEVARLRGVAALLEAAPGLRLRLAGHADRHGTDQANLRLSQRRVAAVERVLVDAGVDPSRIESDAFGESRPLSRAGDQGAYAFDRRVTLTLLPALGPVASAE